MANLPLSLDFTDAIAWQCSSKTPVSLSKKIPVALLPLHRTEPVMSGLVAETHRRGTARNWPPEAQVPIRRNPANGTGRVTLAAAWARLIRSESGGILGETAFAWRPRTDSSIEVSTHKIITDAISAWGPHPEVIVTPDGLGPAGQQALLDAFDNPPKLIPTSIAATIAWCRSRSAPEILPANAAPADGKRCGHLRVLHAGFGHWHAALVPIHATLHANKVMLVPVFSRRLITHHLGITGAALLGDESGLIQMVNEDWPDAPSASNASHLKTASLDAWDPLTAKNHIRDALNGLWARLSSAQENGPCMGTLVVGTLAEQAKQGLREIGHTGAFLKSEPGAASLGASLALFSYRNNEPSWSEQLDPLDFHCLGKDEFGDLMEDWKPLVKSSTVRAWEEFTPAPITGLSVPAGHEKLTLTLRTTTGANHEYRDIKASLTRPPVKSEPVLLHVRINPGQGFSQVRVESVAPNLFHSQLDWKHMEKVDKPNPPKLGYIPRSVVLRAHPTLWQNCIPRFNTFLSKTTQQLAYDTSAANITSILNKWPKADDYERRFGSGEYTQNLYLFYSPIGSDGKLPARTPIEQKSLWERVCARGMELLQTPRFDAQAQKAIRRMLSWAYASTPDYVVKLAASNLRNGMAQDIDLHTAGLCFRSEAQIKLFWESAVLALTSSRPPNHWLRACRNITRLNEHALQPDIVDDRLAECLATALLGQLTQGLDNHRPQIAGNAFEALLHLLKRRRYQPDFLNSASTVRRTLESRLTELNLGLPRRHAEMRPNFLKLLRSEASEADLATLIVSDEEDEN